LGEGEGCERTGFGRLGVFDRGLEFGSAADDDVDLVLSDQGGGADFADVRIRGHRGRRNGLVFLARHPALADERGIARAVGGGAVAFGFGGGDGGLGFGERSAGQGFFGAGALERGFGGRDRGFGLRDVGFGRGDARTIFGVVEADDRVASSDDL